MQCQICSGDLGAVEGTPLLACLSCGRVYRTDQGPRLSYTGARYSEICEYARLLEVPVGPKIETTLTACRAAYKTGLIAAAQAICPLCREMPPVRYCRVFEHLGDYSTNKCPASEILMLLEECGGWKAAWPAYEPEKREGRA